VPTSTSCWTLSCEPSTRNPRRKGRKPAARAYDALIAATALANELPVYTANPDDFRKVDGLEVVAVEPPR
jgi:tRNA(fMet)-specific endonuclease VapC